MSLQQIKRDITELKRSLVTASGPLCKVFISGACGNHTEEEMSAYEAANPHTHIIKLIRKSCRKVE